MAAYAALASVMNIIDNLQLHPFPPISLDQKQAQLLTQKIAFLKVFLEGYNPYLGYSTEADPLESLIADAAYAAEDVIESHIVDQITSDGEKISSDAMYEAPEKLIEEMALIQKEAMEIKQAQHQLHTESTPLDSSRSSSMVGADDVLLQMKDKLTSDRSDLQIIPIVGMGGSGKTTLAINIYQDRLIKERFHICAWATKEYSFRDMLIKVIRQLNQSSGHNLSEDELGEILYEHLLDKKYLVIIDDMWSVEAWDGVKRFLPDNKNGSRIVVTTRLSNLTNSNSLEMKLLDEAESWDLLSKTVFGEKGYPLELEEIGKKIGKSCKGLPLSIVVVGGLLAKSNHSRESWQYIEENLKAIVNLEGDEHCARVLHMCYKLLPVYLKPCFLYMGVFREDEVIRTSKVAKLWVAEGFLKAASGKSLEEIAKEYLEDLIGRNLILIHQLGSIGNIKYCKIHDLLRDLCLREAQKEIFYTTSNPQGMVYGQRRVVISKNEDVNALSSMSLARSLIWNLKQRRLPSLGSRLLRILDSLRFQSAAGLGFLENVDQLVNSRFLCFSSSTQDEFPSSIWLFWNLQTLIVDGFEHDYGPIDIWYMPHIRHLHFQELNLRDPPNGEDAIVLVNLQTLGRIKNFKCSEQVVKRIPNVKKLELCYEKGISEKYCLNNLECLNKLVSLTCIFSLRPYPSEENSLKGNIKFPNSIRKLSLFSHRWDEILDKIGALPLLQKLRLVLGSFEEGKWETTEGQFRSLKFLQLDQCRGLQIWKSESSHFPCLEHLILKYANKLEEIPLGFAEIPTLRVLEVKDCSSSSVVSAKRIFELKLSSLARTRQHWRAWRVLTFVLHATRTKVVDGESHNVV